MMYNVYTYLNLFLYYEANVITILQEIILDIHLYNSIPCIVWHGKIYFNTESPANVVTEENRRNIFKILGLRSAFISLFCYNINNVVHLFLKYLNYVTV